VGNLFVPRSVDNGVSSGLVTALVVNALLLAAFAVQHSVMARVSFKRMWTKIIPEPIERSTFVLFTCFVLVLLFWQWRPLTSTIWLVENEVGALFLQIMFWLGWMTVLLATFMIDHFELFGLRQSWLYLRGKEYTPPVFQTTGLYSFVRHPIMLGFVIAFWATPHMTLGHLVFSIATTGYILVGILFEEKDLVAALGDDYRQYRRRVSMLIPWVPNKKVADDSVAGPAMEQADATG
jgi:protein-S-isoprenylcysteine O-methyltransferase Ste14